MENYPKLNPTTINLVKGETVLWTGTPNPGIRFHPRGFFTMGFWSLLIIFAIFIRTIDETFYYFVVPFTLVTLFHITYLLFIDPIRRKKTNYLVTNQSIIIKSNFISQSVRTVRLNSINNINLNVYRDGTGTIIFDKVTWRDRSSLPPYHLSPVFEFIDEANKVYAIIENARAQILQSEIRAV
jgi:hypothetical protein